jgi:hypothetical protein
LNFLVRFIILSHEAMVAVGCFMSRYIHLNPCVGMKPLSIGRRIGHSVVSYPSYANRQKKLAWLAMDQLSSFWRAEYGGKDPELAYRRLVQRGVSEQIANPLEDALDDWIIGSKRLLKKIVRLASSVTA